MSRFDVRDRDLSRLREVAAALRAPPAAATPAPDAWFGAPAELLSHDPAGPGVRWRSLELLRDLLDVDDVMFHVDDPSNRTWPFGQEVCRGGPDDFWYRDMGPGGPPDTPNAVPADAVAIEERFWDAYGTCPMHCSDLADWGLVIASADLPRRELEERAARLGIPLAHALVTACRIAPGRQAVLMGGREGWGTYSDRARGYLELLKPHFIQAWLSSCAPEPPVTAAQLRVLERVRAGHTNRQVARDLGISEATVRTHLQNAYASLGVTNRVAAVAAAFDSPGVPAQRSPTAPEGRTFTP